MVNIYIIRNTIERSFDYVVDRRTRFVAMYILYWLIGTTIYVISVFFDPNMTIPSNILDLLILIILTYITAFLLLILEFLMLVLVIAVSPQIISVLLGINDNLFINLIGALAMLMLFGIIFFVVSIKIPVDSSPVTISRRTYAIVKKIVVLPLEAYMIFSSGIFVLFSIYLPISLIIPSTWIGSGNVAVAFSILFVLVYYMILGFDWMNLWELIPVLSFNIRRDKKPGISEIWGNVMTADQLLENRLYKLQTAKVTTIGTVGYAKLLKVLDFNTAGELEEFLDNINGKQLGSYSFNITVDKNRRTVSF